MTHHDDARLDDLLAHLGDGDTKDLFRTLLQRGMQELIDAELTATIGAELHERTDARTNQRNGGRSRTLSTPAGDIELRIPKVRVGSFFPSLLEPRRRVDQALWAVIMTAYITGTSTRKIDDLVRALGCESGISKSTVSRICKGIDDEVAVFRTRPLGHLAMPYVFLDATYIKARNQHRIVGRAVVVATAVTIDGTREVLGVDVGDSEDEVFWTAFLRTLRDRGLSGVRLVISDAHSGLKASIARVFAGATWQRCKVHLARNILATVNHAHKDMVAAMVRTIHAQPDAAATRAQLHAVVEMLGDRFPKAAEILAAAEADVTAYAAFPRAHWRKISSTNPLERINKEIKRRSNVVGIFPDDASVIRLVGAVLLEQHDEWAVAERRYLSEESMTLIDQHLKEITATEHAELPAAEHQPDEAKVTDLLPPHHGTRSALLRRQPRHRRPELRDHPQPIRMFSSQQGRPARYRHVRERVGARKRAATRTAGSAILLLMAHDVVLRVAGADAAEDLARIWERATARLRSQPVPSSPDPARVVALAARVGPPTAAAVLAVVDGQTVACCFIEQLVEPDGTPVGEWGHLSGVAVEPQRWGEGLATAVIAHAEVAAIDRGYRAMRLHVLEDNLRARDLYEHLGWTLNATGHPHPAGPQAVYDKALSS